MKHGFELMRYPYNRHFLERIDRLLVWLTSNNFSYSTDVKEYHQHSELIIFCKSTDKDNIFKLASSKNSDMGKILFANERDIQCHKRTRNS